MKKFTRRSFLTWLSLLPTIAHAGFTGTMTRAGSVATGRIRALTYVFGPTDSLIEIGRISLEMGKEAAYSRWSVALVTNIRKAGNSMDRVTLDQFRRHYCQRVNTDFNQGKMVLVNGVYLSSTEFEVSCLLATLETA